VEGLRQFRREYFPKFREHYQRLVSEGQKPSTLFLGCADSRVVPDLLTNALPGDLFVVRNVGNLVPPFEPDAGFHGTSAGIEFATLILKVKDIVVCGHSHCGAIRSLFQPLEVDAPHITRWLELARPAVLDSREMTDETLRRAERGSVALQIQNLMTFPMVRERVERGDLCLHGWHYVIEEGRVFGLDTGTGEFHPLS
jgi:carbonic anhydrase